MRELKSEPLYRIEFDKALFRGEISQRQYDWAMIMHPHEAAMRLDELKRVHAEYKLLQSKRYADRLLEQKIRNRRVLVTVVVIALMIINAVYRHFTR
jgi:hypothetical protein